MNTHKEVMQMFEKRKKDSKEHYERMIKRLDALKKLKEVIEDMGHKNVTKRVFDKFREVTGIRALFIDNYLNIYLDHDDYQIYLTWEWTTERECILKRLECEISRYDGVFERDYTAMEKRYNEVGKALEELGLKFYEMHGNIEISPLNIYRED